jgi:hypothetical protein
MYVMVIVIVQDVIEPNATNSTVQNCDPLLTREWSKAQFSERKLYSFAYLIDFYVHLL